MTTYTSLDDFLGTDLFDTRDLIEFIEETEKSADPDAADELRRARALEELLRDTPDYAYGEAVIADWYFEDYAEQLADDIGAIDRNATWPVNCIDWGKAADDLKADYFRVDFEGYTYWVRA
jgi:hypothetical protein